MESKLLFYLDFRCMSFKIQVKTIVTVAVIMSV